MSEKPTGHGPSLRADISLQNHRMSAMKRSLRIASVACFVGLIGCAARQPLYPQPDASASASVLVFDNQTGLNRDVAVSIDGFQVARSRPFGVGLPGGKTTLRVLPGSHEIQIVGIVSGPYFYNPVLVRVETEENSSYTIRFTAAGRLMRPGYAIEYEGWTNEQKAQWPTESYIANALF